MNKDLRSGDSSKIEKYLELINLMNYFVENEFIKSFNGELFRGTKIKVDFIEEKIIVGKVLTNLSFWSASKSRKIAEKFLIGKNILFLIKTKKNNIDIDIEQISKFGNEQEVLFLPYSKFLVKSRTKKLFNGNEIYEVELEGIDDSHERKNIKSKSINQEELFTLMEVAGPVVEIDE